MTPEEQRIAIAEACGWTARSEDSASHLKQWLSPNKKDPNWHFLPDYLNDLNAMHEAEMQMLERHPDLRRSYRKVLIDVCDDTRFGKYWLATAAQRAEAFLRTLGKWVD